MAERKPIHEPDEIDQSLWTAITGLHEAHKGRSFLILSVSKDDPLDLAVIQTPGYSLGAALEALEFIEANPAWLRVEGEDEIGDEYAGKLPPKT